MEIQKSESKSVPLLIYESEMKHKTNIIKGLLVVIMLLIIVFGITVYLFMEFIGSYDYSKYSQDGEGVNNINSGTQGDIINESDINITK